jgi:hypothetical protein
VRILALLLAACTLNACITINMGPPFVCKDWMATDLGSICVDRRDQDGNKIPGPFSPKKEKVKKDQ